MQVNMMGVVSKQSQEVHSVCVPPKKTTLDKLKDKLCEVFFPDDPLYKYRNQPWKTKLFLGIQSVFPVFQWGPEYTLQLFRSDIISGLTIASLAIPQGISYAKLANLPPTLGLYSSFVPPLIYSLLGSSRHLGVGTVSVASLVMGSMLSESVSPTDQTSLYLKLAFTATFFAGIFQASLGLLRLGFIIDFLSQPTLIGFMAGSAIIVALQQLKGLLNIYHFTGKMQLIPVMASVFRNRNEWSWETVVMGSLFLVVLLTTREIGKRKPKLFWVAAAAPLTSVIVSTLITFLLKSKAHGISFIGHLPKGVNPPSFNMLHFSGPELGLAIKTGIVTGLLSLCEGIAVGRTFAAKENYQVDGNKEMMAIGIMNIISSCFSCYVSTGSFSRSAINYNAGAKTTVSNIVMAAAVLITMLFVMPLFYYTPNVILAAIIITAVIGLIDYQAAYRFWKVDKIEFLACVCSFLGVLFISVPMGLAIAVGISVFKILLHVTRPNIGIMGNIPGTHIYHNINQYREATRIPSFLILSIDSPIYFANATYIQERIQRCVREEEQRILANDEHPLKCVILDLTAVTSIDSGGTTTIRELKKIFNKRSLQLVLVNPVGSVIEKFQQAKILEMFGIEGIYLTVEEAVFDISSLWKNDQA